jgi:hypothetical protein
MNEDKSRLQTILVKQLLEAISQRQDFDAMVINDYHTSILLLRIHFTAKPAEHPYIGATASRITCYSYERLMFGKATRLLMALDAKHELMAYLKQENIDKIIVTSVKNPEQMNNTNRVSFQTNVIAPALMKLRQVARTGEANYKLAIRGFIDENAS